MTARNNLEDHCHRILEENGGIVADRARTILLEDPDLKELQPPLEFISKNWRDPLTPSMMTLSCEAVGGRSEDTYEAALTMSLMNLCFYVWDDIIDKAQFKSFKPTLFWKFGEETALIVGGLASAKAFSILNQMKLDEIKHQTIAKLFWNLWTKIAKAEIVDLRSIKQANLSSRKKLWKIKTEAAADLETCLRMGAVLGNGSESEVKNLGNYGLCLGMILELWKDLYVSINLTSELDKKIRSGGLPYSLLWAREHSEKIHEKLENLVNKNAIESSDIKDIVEEILETEVLNNTLKSIRRFTEKAEKELSELKMNSAVQTLKFFVKAQPELLTESLLRFQV